MIIDSIKITNFGLYKGENTIQLSPDTLLNRNITVVSGQNGVGKSTLLEAIHLCLLGSLSIDDRVSEANYEKHLFKRSYKGSIQEPIQTSIELLIEFIKSGSPVKYKIKRHWKNNANDVDESIFIEEDGKPLNELSKKEKNLFLRELIQPGLAKVMFFDGEKLLSLYNEGNLTSFIAESCRYLFGLNFVDLLNTDLNYYINKLYSQQDPSSSLTEIKKVRDELNKINTEIISLEDEKSEITSNLIELKNIASQAERQISDQGRWAANTLDGLKQEKLQLESAIVSLKKELIELYSTLGPFIFCKNLIRSLKERLIIERDIDKWQHARDLLKQKISELEVSFNDSKFLNDLSLNPENGKKLFPVLKDILLSTPKLFSDGELIHHEMADNERSKLISWIDESLNNVSGDILKKSESISLYEERLKVLSKEQSSFSKDDVIVPLLKEIQEVNKKIGANEQKLSSLNRKADEANKRREFYTNRLFSLEQKLQQDSNVDEKLKLSSRTKLVLEAYAQQLLSKKLHLLKEKVLHKFNLLCRKDSYLDNLIIDPQTFEIRLGRNETIVEHAHLSAGEKQLLIISFLWGLRELTNIALPLIIDTPLARLDLEHRKAFIEQFLPAIQPQVILIGTDMELAGNVIESLEPHIAHHYLLEYNSLSQATELKTIERLYKDQTVHEV